MEQLNNFYSRCKLPHRFTHNMENSRNNLRNFDKKTWFYQSTFTLMLRLLYNAIINWHFRSSNDSKLCVSLWIFSHHSMANFNLVSSSDEGARSHSPFTKLYDVAMFITHGFRKNKSEYLNIYTSRETKNSLDWCRSLLNAQKVNPKVIIFYVEIKSSSFSSVSINIASHISLCLYFILSSLLYFKSQQNIFRHTFIFDAHIWTFSATYFSQFSLQFRLFLRFEWNASIFHFDCCRLEFPERWTAVKF